MSEINDPNKWRVSKTGYSIRTGWGDEKILIAKYAGKAQPLDNDEFQAWIENAELICELHNRTDTTIEQCVEAVRKRQQSHIELDKAMGVDCDANQNALLQAAYKEIILDIEDL